jgi:hypothetical protein
MSIIVKLGDGRGLLSRSVSSRQISAPKTASPAAPFAHQCQQRAIQTVNVESLNSKNAPAPVSKLETNPHRHSLAA